MIRTATTLAYAGYADIGQWSASRPLDFPRVAPPPRVAHTTINTYDEASGPAAEFAPHFAKLRALSRERSLWPEGGEAPNEFSLAWAQIALQQLQNDMFAPTKVVASAEGGVAICLIAGDKYADIEFLNTGEILGVVSNRQDRPAAWEIEQSTAALAQAAARIRHFLDASATPKDVATRKAGR